MRLGMDLDGVLINFIEPFYWRFAQTYLPSPSWRDPFVDDRFHFIENDHSFWSSLPAIPHDEIPDFCCYITARPLCTYAATVESIKKLGLPDKPVIMVGSLQEKSTACLSLGITHFVDDAPHNIDDLRSNGIEAFLWDHASNRDYDTPYRIQDFKDLIRLFPRDPVA